MELPPPLPTPSGFLAQGKIRFCHWWWAKTLTIILSMVTFFTVYFWVLRHPLRPITIMPLTALDRLIEFQPAALPLYLSLWLYVSLAPTLLIERRELFSYGLAAVVLSVVGLGIFMIWPTAVPVPAIDWSLYPAFALLKSADATGNACPSLHVAFAVFTAIWFERLLRQLSAGGIIRSINWLWCAGIIYSTVAIHQHVVLDAVAGSALGALVAAAHLRWLHRPI